MTNTGQISGYGLLRTGGSGPLGPGELTNNGTITFTGGFTTVNGNVTNNPGHQVRVAYNPALFTGTVTNKGIFKNTATTVTFAGSYIENGTYISDPADNFFADAMIGPDGAWVGGVGDHFYVSGSLLSSSAAKNSWNTAEADLFLLGNGTQYLSVTGNDFGPHLGGYVDNFAWGSLTLGAGEALSLLDGNAVPGGALYVGALHLAGGVEQLMSIDSHGMSIYYQPDDPANAWLASQSFALLGGGVVAPVPEPSGLVLFVIAAAAMGLVRLYSHSPSRQLRN